VEKTHASETSIIFIAMNRFKVIKEERKAIEDLCAGHQDNPLRPVLQRSSDYRFTHRISTRSK
jgi:hypothetical protein